MVGGVSGFARAMPTVIRSRIWLRAGRRRCCAQLGLYRIAIALPVVAYHYSPTTDLLGSHCPARMLCSGDGVGEVGGLPEPPILSGPSDHLTALTTWYGLLHQDIRKILDEIGPRRQPVIEPSVRDPLHATG